MSPRFFYLVRIKKPYSLFVAQNENTLCSGLLINPRKIAPSFQRQLDVLFCFLCD